MVAECRQNVECSQRNVHIEMLGLGLGLDLGFPDKVIGHDHVNVKVLSARLQLFVVEC